MVYCNKCKNLFHCKGITENTEREKISDTFDDCCAYVEYDEDESLLTVTDMSRESKMTHIFGDKKSLSDKISQCGSTAIDTLVDEIPRRTNVIEDEILLMPVLFGQYTHYLVNYIMKENQGRIKDSDEMDSILKLVGVLVIDEIPQELIELIGSKRLAHWLGTFAAKVSEDFYPETLVT